MNTSALYAAVKALIATIVLLTSSLTYGIYTFQTESSNSTKTDLSIKKEQPLGQSTVSTASDLGKTIFRNNCASCHNRNMIDDLTGPALAGVQERWADYPLEDLYAWIRNSQQLYKTGHPKAKALIDEWESVMTSFPNLEDEDIEALLAYIDKQSKR